MKKILFFLLLCGTNISIFAQGYSDYLGAGHADEISVSSSDSQSNGMKSLNGEGYELEIQGASRFLAHAQLGATIDEVQELTEMSIEEWIDDQMLIPGPSYALSTVEIIFELLDRCQNLLGVDGCAQEFVVSQFMWRYAWWHNTMNNEDKLRQRVAMALSEILVVSDRSQLENLPHGLAYFYDILSDNAFGNYRDLLEEVTMSPAMGFYLSHMNNFKSIPSLNIRPDENYAREIMQLFSIGLYELKQNGARKVDMSTGLWIPTYDNEDIKGLAKVFTGLSGSVWADDMDTSPVLFGRNPYSYSFLDPMRMYENWHEPGTKEILGDYVIPANQTGMEDVQEALDVLFNHENVGPFLATRLIQRLVKSNPSGAYIERVANVFADNGQGVRGDLGAMVKAILMDTEAMECYWIDDTRNGVLREPMLRYTQLMINMQARVDSDWFWNSGAFFNEYTRQHVLSAPTVFNFFTPDYVPDSDFAYEQMVGPEFQILNSSTSSNYVNYMLIGLMRDYFKDNFNFDVPNVLNDHEFIPFTTDLNPYQAKLSDETWLSLADKPEELVDYLDILLTNGQLSEEKKERVVDAMNQSNIFEPREAAHYALFVIMIDPDYVVMK